MFFTYYSLQYPLRVSRILLKNNNFTITRKTITTTPIRSDIFNIGKRMKNEQFYKKMDQIEPASEYELVYRAPQEYTAAFCRHVPTFNLITVTALLACNYAMGNILEPTDQFIVGPTMSDGNELVGFNVAFYIFNISLTYFITKYPLRIYKGKDQYVAMFEGFLPRSPRQYIFRKGDVCQAKSILPWHESMFMMKDRNVLLFSHHFRKPADFHDMFKK